ncbi:MAG: 4-hydroxy-tetrahydrodipicolinate reductase [Candidatus Cloacimonadota bacterium]|nr:MAG: 4-hydroxy-tetrahydrodipicolinate reductase [Candidatus Cloacimonadota bacterium]
MIKLAIVGYGQMGQLIEKLAPEYNFEVISIIDPLLNNEINEQTLGAADVCLEFTAPFAAFDNISKIISLKKNLVTGTTGWFNKLSNIEKLVEKNGTGFIFGSNFSPGMNLFYKIIEETTKLINQAEDYDVYGLEAHHNKKKDSPSGTAKILSEIVLKNIDRKEKAQYKKLDRKIDADEFHFASLRAGNIPGTHTIGFDSTADSIELTHTTRNRTGLAIGALKAASWICDRKGFYNFADVFQEII